MTALSLSVLSASDVALTATLDAITRAQSAKRFTALRVPGAVPTPGGRSKNAPVLLTDTTKMPCPSWSLPARRACPGARYGENDICRHCYATKNAYDYAAVRHAQSARFSWTLALMKSPAGRDAFVAYMTIAVRLAAQPRPERRRLRKTVPAQSGGFFRVHDSGDLFSAEYTRCWERIAANLPEIRIWFPTRSYRIPAILPAIQALAALPNVTVRPSALAVDDAPPVIDGLQAGSGAASVKAGANCPAYLQDGACHECRQCWVGTVPVLYPLH